MLKDKNQNNYHKALRCVITLLNNFDIGKLTLHYILPNLCDKPPPAKSRTAFDEIISRIMDIDSDYLFSEIMGRVKQKNSVMILHNLELIHKLVAEQKLTNPDVECL
jgi:hypothetical protein